jgi:hypothetical protein
VGDVEASTAIGEPRTFLLAERRAKVARRARATTDAQ